MKKCATVVDPGTASTPVLVRPERSASCGSCHACVGASGRVEPVPATTPFPVQKGERVIVESDTGSSILQALKIFFLPLVGFWVCFGLLLVLMPGGEGVAGIGGIGGFLLVFFLIRINERRRSGAGRHFYRIISRLS